MSSRFTRFLKLTLGASLLGAAVGVFGISQGAIAQALTSPSSAANDFQTPRDGTSDPFSSRGDGGINTMLDLIHRANFGEIRSSDQFQQDQRNSINTEAENFRNMQQRLLQQQQQPAAPVAPLATPQP